MQTLESISAVDLFPLERAALLDLLESLDPPAWERETVCAGWAVRDIAAHLVGDDLGLISRVRDAYRLARRDDEDLVEFVNRQNAEWVQATRRLSPAVLRTLLGVGGRETQRHFEALDPFATGGPVSWATFAHAIPWTFRAVERPQGTAVTLLVSGESGDAWSIVREGARGVSTSAGERRRGPRSSLLRMTSGDSSPKA